MPEDGRNIYKTCRELAARLLPAVEDCSVQTASVRLFNRIERFFRERPDHRLLEITEDNVIDASERPDLDLILADLEELTKAFMELRLAAGRGT